MKVPVKILFIDLLLLLICFPGIIQISNKADVPFTVTGSEKGVTVTKDFDDIKANDQIISLNRLPLSSTHFLEFLTDTYNPGDVVNLELSRSNKNYTAIVKLGNYYDNSYVISVIIIGLSFFSIGLILLLKGTERTASLVFHWAAVSTAIILFCTWGSINILPYKLGYFVRSFFHLGYTLAPALFIHFAYLFPVNIAAKRKSLIIFFYFSAAVIFVILSYTFIAAATDVTPQNINVYLNVSNILRIFVISGVLLSVLIFTRSYIKASTLEVRKKIKWILFGFITGPIAYIFTWVVPQAFNFSIIPEIAAIFFMLSVPLTFAISILKYRLLDIDIVINRSIVYAVSAAGLILIYFALVFLISDMLFKTNDTLSSVISVVTVAVLFQPVKVRVQKFVDLKFFRVQYDFRKAVNKFFSGLKQSKDFKGLSEYVVNETGKIIPLTGAGILFYDGEKEEITDRYHFGFNILNDGDSLIALQHYLVQVKNPAACKQKLEAGIEIASADKELHNKFNISIIIPVVNEEIIYGYFICGDKKSGSRFHIEDVELLKMVAIRTALEISRIKLNQKLLYEQLQSEKLKELDKLKSFFISSTAHELKTPLSSIRLFSELLEGNVKESKKGHVEIITGECDRLTRLIDNLLDISRIERKEKKYELNSLSVIDLIGRSLLVMEYQFNIVSCKVSFLPCEGDPLISGDEDTLLAALINIYNNALKYSTDPKKIDVKITNVNNFVRVAVSDNGMGIDENEIQNIMQPYFRSTLVKNKNFIGTGIGLALVKHAMEAHNGKIYIESEPGKGSTFTLEFPLCEQFIEKEDRFSENKLSI